VKKTLLLCAMPEELEIIKNSLKFEPVKQYNFLPWPVYKHPDLNVYAGVTGISKVNAAACASVLLNLLKPEQLIGIGVAGAVDPKLKIGDIIISNSAIQYDVDARTFGYQLGEVPRMGTIDYKADDNLYTTALKVSQTMDLDSNIFIGQIMSGDCFVSGTKGSEIFHTFKGQCVDMESAAWAQVAHVYKVPWLILRSMSDQADGTAPDDFDAFLPHAVNNLSHLVEELLKNV
jgi:adenosylhomocysteine nucleosidase